MKSNGCFVPNCKNTVGVTFPKDPGLKSKWLENLKINDIIPDETSIVCLDHFNNEDIKFVQDEDANADSENSEKCRALSENAVPVLKNSASFEEITTENDNEAKVLSSVAGVAEEAADNKLETENSVEIMTENQINESEGKPVENLDLKICRLCGVKKENTKNLYKETLENDVSLFSVIKSFLYPIELSEHDNLSKQICESCLQTISTFHAFKNACLQNDKQQNLKISQNFSQTQKRKLDENSQLCRPSTSKKVRLSNSDTDEEFDNDDLDSLSDFLIKKEPSESKTASESSSTSVVIQKKTIKASKQSEIDQKFDKVEQELRRVLEGSLTAEQAKAENIIIHVQNDDEEEESPNKVATLKKLKLPIVIKPVDNRGRNLSVYSRRKVIIGDVKSPTKIKRGDTEVTIPKEINVVSKEVYKSDVGIFQGMSLRYVFNTEFCLVDGYLFEYRLCKGNERYLRCVLPSCQALAMQKRSDGKDFSEEVTVQKAHHHKRPGEGDKKRQMFYYVMKRKMQSDKTLNFRSVYDEVCKHDPEIKSLVPLRNVINEICKHQLNYKIPPIESFDQFFNHVEEDAFQKLHFTLNGKQFYQEKFLVDDGSKAIVFANCEIIEQVSFTNLMYVDASFKIDTNEEFSYQLVTVLVWIDESYYPILFSLVNRKTQLIYKKVFEYLHDTLAPKLRPEEIVTDYEANLYYALGETYLDSSIGGSVFYYTQNLYKKICSLNLSRDLETNSYFRNVYHMLLMLPLLPVNTILDGLNNMETQAKDLGLSHLTKLVFEHVRSEWITKVTPDLFCVHRLENRINENVIAPFKKLRDFIMLSKGKTNKQNTSIVNVVEKLIDLEHFLQITYSAPNKKSFARDLSSSQKKNVLKAWQFIESHPKININNFFSKVLGYIKCMENQLWIWGFYRYEGKVTDDLINASNFSIISSDVEIVSQDEGENERGDEEFAESDEPGTEAEAETEENCQVVMEAVIDENGTFVLQDKEVEEEESPIESTFLTFTQT